MPPIHPAVVHFPLALIVFSVVADLVGRFTNRGSLRAAAWWGLVGAAVTAVAAGAAGYYDMQHADLNEPTHELVHLHMWVGVALTVGIVGLLIWRWRVRREAQQIGAAYSTVALLVMALALFQGWYGGEMVYSHGASVAETGQGTEPAEAAKQRLEGVHEELKGLAPGPKGEASGETNRSQPKPSDHGHQSEPSDHSH